MTAIAARHSYTGQAAASGGGGGTVAALVSMLNAPLGLTVGSLANVITFHLTFPHWWCSSDSYSGVISGHSVIQSPSRFIAIHSDLFYKISYGK